ncbi:MAG: DUF4214 domain-containing protein [Clostridia bacterium]|nr:DUF4214 domain-containing protein [Clostridia bacterium]
MLYNKKQRYGMKKILIKRMTAGMLMMVMLWTGTVNAYALETEENGETVESIETLSEETESETVEPAAAIETEAEEGVLRENSFRYQDGEWVPEERAYYANGFEPWSFVNGNWINSFGDAIPGALAKGIDVSYIQKNIDWEAVLLSDVDYAIIRCGYGNNFASQDDSYWKRNADECTRLDIPFGVYIYSYAMDVEEARSEAEHVLRLVEGYDLTLPIYYDLEDSRFTGTLSNTEIADIAEVFCNTIEGAGYEVGIYANLDWFENKLTDSRFDQWQKWIAQYNYRCSYPGSYAMWQCTASGVVDGIDNAVDLNFAFMEVPARAKNVQRFVERLYNLILGREADRPGLRDWKWRLLNQEETGAEVARGFIMSQEFMDRGLTDEEYVEVLYQTCFNRSADSDGKAYWMKRLGSRLSREYVLHGFIESQEFTDICASYDIIRGNTELSDVLDLNPDMTLFVYRNYNQFLGREPDAEGLPYWVRQLAEGQSSPREVAHGFVFSEEVMSKNLSDEEYVKVLYRGIFDREADPDGLADWTNRLSQGQSREEIFDGFANSAEFLRLVQSFGL